MKDNYTRDEYETLLGTLENEIALRKQVEYNFKELLRQNHLDAVRMRNAGLTYDAIRYCVRDLANEEITVGRLVELVRCAADLLANEGRLTP